MAGKAYLIKKSVEAAPKILLWALAAAISLVLIVVFGLMMFVGVLMSPAASATAPGVNGQGWTHPVPSMQRWDTYGANSHAAGAIDFPAAEGDPVFAAGPGTVRVAGGTGTTYGLAVLIEHSDGTSTMYAHLSRVYASVGQLVTGGAQIGAVGRTGGDYGPHLHLEAKVGTRVSDRAAQLPTYKYMLERGVDLGPCFGGPCALAGY